MLARETPQAKIAREGREQTAQGYQMPGRSGPHVFIWEEVDGHWMRQRLFRAAVEDHWGSYTDSQRRFNSFDNEWDLAIQFDPDAEPSDEDEEDDSYFVPA